jgi:hypothetical protein
MPNFHLLHFQQHANERGDKMNPLYPYSGFIFVPPFIGMLLNSIAVPDVFSLYEVTIVLVLMKHN